MKKLILTSAIAFATLFASAQNFMVVSTYDGDQEEMMDKVTQNFGFGYALNDTWTLGMIQAGEDSLGDMNYDLWARYNLNGDAIHFTSSTNGRNDGQYDNWYWVLFQCMERT